MPKRRTVDLGASAAVVAAREYLRCHLSYGEPQHRLRSITVDPVCRSGSRPGLAWYMVTLAYGPAYENRWVGQFKVWPDGDVALIRTEDLE